MNLNNDPPNVVLWNGNGFGTGVTIDIGFDRQSKMLLCGVENKEDSVGNDFLAGNAVTWTGRTVSVTSEVVLLQVVVSGCCCDHCSDVTTARLLVISSRVGSVVTSTSSSYVVVPSAFDNSSESDVVAESQDDVDVTGTNCSFANSVANSLVDHASLFVPV